ncbi:hypothetical protein BC834DRAFT_893058 [Gloeopeniophorella convolvens]|nr:hypothetical protein BC834DRAFT_893058 [Gloeopeniophorella convolvens]
MGFLRALITPHTPVLLAPLFPTLQITHALVIFVSMPALADPPSANGSAQDQLPGKHANNFRIGRKADPPYQLMSRNDPQLQPS